MKRTWRHYKITKVEYITNPGDANGYRVHDCDAPGFFLSVPESSGVIPRVGDNISYYGRFQEGVTSVGVPIEVLVIGERVIWDHTGGQE